MIWDSFPSLSVWKSLCQIFRSRILVLLQNSLINSLNNSWKLSEVFPIGFEEQKDPTRSDLGNNCMFQSLCINAPCRQHMYFHLSNSLYIHQFDFMGRYLGEYLWRSIVERHTILIISRTPLYINMNYKGERLISLLN